MALKEHLLYETAHIWGFRSLIRTILVRSRSILSYCQFCINYFLTRVLPSRKVKRSEHSTSSLVSSGLMAPVGPFLTTTIYITKIARVLE
jgi:hypothetical protein